MLDLHKYLNRAAADLGFRARLLKNANQAIKNEFGEDLPYKLKCKEKLVFEIEAMDGLSDSDLESVAGGSGDEEQVPVSGDSSASPTIYISNSSWNITPPPPRFGRLVYGARNKFKRNKQPLPMPEDI